MALAHDQRLRPDDIAQLQKHLFRRARSFFYRNPRHFQISRRRKESLMVTQKRFIARKCGAVALAAQVRGIGVQQRMKYRSISARCLLDPISLFDEWIRGQAYPLW